MYVAVALFESVYSLIFPTETMAYNTDYSDGSTPIYFPSLCFYSLPLFLCYSVLNSHQLELNRYFGNLSDIITVTSKPIISSGGGGATDIAFIVMGLVVGSAAIFGILLLSIYWKQ